jgi:hypothetical protein
MTITAEELKKMQELIKSKRKLPVDTLFKDINEENKTINRKKVEVNVTNEPLMEKLKFLIISNKAIFIKGNAPSLKNSKQIITQFTGSRFETVEKAIEASKSGYIAGRNTSKGFLLTRPSLVSSTVVQSYISTYGEYWLKYQPVFLELIKNIEKRPLFIGLYFVRDSLRNFDFNNATQIITDCMRDYFWIKDDDVNNIIPVYIGHHKNSEKPGTVITILSEEYTTNLINYL